MPVPVSEAALLTLVYITIYHMLFIAKLARTG